MLRELWNTYEAFVFMKLENHKLCIYRPIYLADLQDAKQWAQLTVKG